MSGAGQRSESAEEAPLWLGLVALRCAAGRSYRQLSSSLIRGAPAGQPAAGAASHARAPASNLGNCGVEEQRGRTFARRCICCLYPRRKETAQALTPARLPTYRGEEARMDIGQWLAAAPSYPCLHLLSRGLVPWHCPSGLDSLLHLRSLQINLRPSYIRGSGFRTCGVNVHPVR